MVGPQLAGHIQVVQQYRERLAVLQGAWDSLMLLAQMNGGGLDLQTTRTAFERLTGTLLENLATESVRKTSQEMTARAQIAIDVMVRNLYERTADIGFLATDSDVRQFCTESCRQQSVVSGPPPSRRATELRNRLAEYVARYSVYDDIVLLSPDGDVLLQLTGEPAVSRCRDPLVRQTLSAQDAYVETFRAVDLFPQRRHSLVYSHRVVSAGSTAGVLCLSFRFDDETQGIFSKLLDERGWTALVFTCAQGNVIASSDPWQFPVGAPVFAGACGDKAGMQTLRFAGREYLAATCKARPYQGYLGPEWHSHALLPIEHACNREAGMDAPRVPAEVLGAIRSSRIIFSPALREVPVMAESIQRNLTRSVWNGHMRLDSRSDAGAFIKVLLREISGTGKKTQDVFDRSIGELQDTVVSSVMLDCRATAALAMDLLDRNLYERANDCRWWSLDRTLVAGLDGNGGHDEVTAVLRKLNQLYTVYHTLVLFDAGGRVSSVSNPRYAPLIGKTPAEPWMQATLSRREPGAFTVSRFSPSVFHDGQATLIYAAAIRSASGQVCGGIGLVFDTAPQLKAMLTDALSPAIPGSLAVFASTDGYVLAATDRYAPGDRLELPAELLQCPRGGTTRILELDETLYAVGVCPGNGYREYRGLGALALMMVPLGHINTGSGSPLQSAARTATYGTTAGNRVLEMATFHVGEHWLAIPLEQVVEALEAGTLHRLPQRTEACAGYVMHGGQSVLVADLPVLLGTDTCATSQEIVMVRLDSGRSLGLLVDRLGDIPRVDADHVVPTPALFVGGRGMTPTMVRPGQADDPPLLILDPGSIAHTLSMSPLRRTGT